MTINFKLNDEDVNINVNSNEPLSFTIRSLSEDVNRFPACRENTCGHCIVYDRSKNELLLSCLTPAFHLEGADIITPDYFYASKKANYIKLAYKDVHVLPCDECIQKITLVLDWIISIIEKKQVYIKDENDSIFFLHLEEEHNRGLQSPEDVVESEKAFILSSASVVKCSCLTPNDVLTITEAAIVRRRRSNV